MIGRIFGILLLAVLLGLSQQALATHAPDHFDLITPGEGMGPVKLGMTRAKAIAAVKSMACGYAISILYDGAGRVSRIETNCGGALRTAEGLQVGISMADVLEAYGIPQEVENSDVYEHGVARWFSYRTGIAFRAVVFGPTPEHSVVTTIAVFRPGRRS